VMQPLKDKSLLRFGIKGATITPSLRRTIDASAFPSVIRQITPYIVSNRGQSDVRFAVELKGDTPYELKNDGKIVTLIVENGSLAKRMRNLKRRWSCHLPPLSQCHKKRLRLFPRKLKLRQPKPVPK